MKLCCSLTLSKDLLEHKSLLRVCQVRSSGFRQTPHNNPQEDPGHTAHSSAAIRQSTTCAGRTLRAPTKPYFHSCLSRNPTSALQDRTSALRSSGRGGSRAGRHLCPQSLHHLSYPHFSLSNTTRILPGAARQHLGPLRQT